MSSSYWSTSRSLLIRLSQELAKWPLGHPGPWHRWPLVPMEAAVGAGGWAVGHRHFSSDPA